MIAAVPAGAALYGRAHVGDAAGAYGGTSIGATTQVVKTTWYHVISASPGAAWPLSHEVLGGPPRVSLLAIIATIASTFFVFRFITATDFHLSKTWFVLLGLGIYFALSCLILGLTEKVQNETTRIGQVYLEYIPGVIFWVFIILIVALLSKKAKSLGRVVPVVLATLALLQFTVNWRLAESLNRSFVPNRQLIAAYSRDSSESERCMALWNWRNGIWPDYYRDTMTRGLDAASRVYFGRPFCR